MYRPDRGLGACGLACAACSATDCPGCTPAMASECDHHKGCEAESCWACDRFPCDRHAQPRRRAMVRYARESGAEALLERLRRNENAGIRYHRAGIWGDYDAFDDEADILRLLREGDFPDPYERRPAYQTDRFRLVPISREHAADLLAVYADPSTRAHADATHCTCDFAFDTLEQMRACIEDWLVALDRRDYIRWAVLDRRDGRAVGTIEFFVSPDDDRATGTPTDLGILRVDLRSDYETTEGYLDILDAVLNRISKPFRASVLIAKVLEEDAARVAAFEARGFARMREGSAAGVYMGRAL